MRADGPAGRALAALLLLGCVGAQAGEAWRRTGADGGVHDGERPPAAAARRWPGGAPAPIARLRIEQGEGETLAWAQNPLDGPVQVMLRAEDGTAPQAVPALPARATVPARTEVLLTRIAGHGPPARLALSAVPGPPGARPREVEYGYPLDTADLRVAQGWGGRYSHADAQNLHAVDFAAPVGTPVLAARDGTVMQIESGYTEAGTGSEDLARANFVRILHDDGSMALYAHLDAGGVRVRPGQRVRRGERIARSGDTGFSSGPHLHFAVQANRGMRLETVPFRMFGPRGVLRFYASPPSPAD
ncbi:M23 family metallopeptidase [Luteimonas huabeiensis]|uniref:M23 family metallopeptidase n=1 Tax=Luteimonas huabeiensis TaxID=1244513 RepID=UPI000463E9D0|nr:M23 family metallopeptidase [Luteimonas huabeiensis]